MQNFIKSKKQLAVTILLAISLLFRVLVSITYIDKMILGCVQVIFNKTLRKPERWIDILQNTASLAAFALILVYFLTFTPYGKLLRVNMRQIFSEYKKSYFNFITLNRLIFLSAFLFMAYFGIIRSNYFYSDDIFRNYGGNRSWIGFSRYISEFGSILIHNSLRLSDVSPLTQLIAIVISAITLIVLSISLTGSLKIKNLLALSIIFISPFYSENISYRFDSPYMAMSLFFSAIPFLFKKDSACFVFVSLLGLIFTCMSYQAALPLYILVTIFLFIKNFVDGKNIRKNIIFSAKAVISFVAALVIFKIFFMNKMTNKDTDYFSTRIMISAFAPNLITYIKTTFSLNGGLLTKSLSSIAVVSAIFATTRSSKRNKFLSCAVIVMLIILSYSLSFGPYLIFERPIFKSRAFMGFNSFMALIMLMNINFPGKDKKGSNRLQAVIVTLYVYSCLVFLSVYGNCLKNQNDYENFRVGLILQDLSEMASKNSQINVSFIGSLDLCEKNRIALKNYPLIEKIIPILPTESSSWNYALLNGYNFNCKSSYTKLTPDYSLMKETTYHDIYQKEDDFIVMLR